MKQRILTVLLVLFQAIHLYSQIDSSLFYGYEESPRLGVKQTLKVQFDGDNLSASLSVQGLDTCAVLKGTLTDLQQRISRWYVLGYIYHNGEAHILSNSRSSCEVRKNGNWVNCFYQFNPIPIVIDGLDSIEFRLAKREVDSVLFFCKGKDHCAYSKPTPAIYSHDTLIWQTNTLLQKDDTLKVKLFFEGSNKGIFALSKFTLQDKNRKTDSLSILKSLLYILPFWFLLWLLLTHKEIFGSNIGIINPLITWLPILSGFYFVIFFCDLFYPFEDIRVGMSLQEAADVIARNRFIVLGGSILLFLAQWFFFKNNNRISSIFIKKLLAVIAVSGIVLVGLGLINYLAELIIFHTDRKNLGESMKLQVRMNYVAFLGTLGGLFILFCIYKLFSFNRRYMLFACIFTLVFIILRIVLFFPEPPPPPNNHRGIAEAYLQTVFLIEYEFLFAVPLIILIMILDKTENLSNKRIVLFSSGAFLFIFCSYATTGLFDLFIGVPVTLVFSYFIGRYFLLSDLKTKIKTLRNLKPLFELEKTDKRIFTKLFELKQYENVKAKYRDKLLKGEMLPAEFDKANADLEEKIKEAVPAGINRDLIHQRMNYPFYENNLKNAEHATVYGMVISILLLSFLFRFIPLNFLSDNSLTNDIAFDLLFYVMIPCFMFTAASFCLGYFFIYFKGDSGWKKGFYLGLAIALAHLPYQYLISGKLNLMFFLVPVMREILIMTLVGFLAFDFSTIRKIYGKDFSPKHLAQVEGIQNIIWLATIILSALGAAVTAWLTGNFSSLLNNIK